MKIIVDKKRQGSIFAVAVYLATELGIAVTEKQTFPASLVS